MALEFVWWCYGFCAAVLLHRLLPCLLSSSHHHRRVQRQDALWPKMSNGSHSAWTTSIRWTSGSSSRGIMSLSTISKLLTVRFFCVSVERVHALGSQMTTMWYVLLHLENCSSLLPKLKAEKNVHWRDILLNEGYGLTINTFFMELVTMKGLCNTMKLSLICLKFLGQDWNGISWRQKGVDLESQICMGKKCRL